jgi:hypothetical protein
MKIDLIYAKQIKKRIVLTPNEDTLLELFIRDALEAFKQDKKWSDPIYKKERNFVKRLLKSLVEIEGEIE